MAPASGRRREERRDAAPACGVAVPAGRFASEGAALRGRLYLPDTDTPPPHPLVVMAPGSSATIRMAFDRHAEALAARGPAVLLYDRRNTGESGGEPSRELSVWVQARG